MKNLKPPTGLNHNSILDDIISSKKDIAVTNYLESIKKHLTKRYLEYEENFNKISLTKLSNSIVKSDNRILSCYTSGGRNITSIKQHIKQLQDKFSNEKCMYCQIKDPDSFDHYLPKDDYPEFCALALNLIPCCITCNKKKDVYWKENGETGIINFYIDALPINQILFVEIKISGRTDNTPTAVYFIKNNSNVDAKTFKIFTRHYNRLNLLERYNEKSDSAISELKRTLNSYGRSLSQSNAMKATLEYANQLNDDYGVNYWKSVFFKELSTKEEFFE
jgi:hypothetical protein